MVRLASFHKALPGKSSHKPSYMDAYSFGFKCFPGGNHWTTGNFRKSLLDHLVLFKIWHINLKCFGSFEVSLFAVTGDLFIILVRGNKHFSTVKSEILKTVLTALERR